MLLSFSELVKKYDLKISGILQVGAHFAEEHNEYVQNGIKKMVYIEPCAKAFGVLKNKLSGVQDVNVFLINYACSDFNGKSVMYTGDNTVNKGQSNSLLKPLKHYQIHPEVEFTDTEIVSVIRLDELELRGFNFLNMDCQGTEGSVLRGGMETLKEIDYVYSEVNRDEVYEGCTQVDELDEILKDFDRVETGFWCGGMWTDALYKRKNGTKWQMRST